MSNQCLAVSRDERSLSVFSYFQLQVVRNHHSLPQRCLLCTKSVFYSVMFMLPCNFLAVSRIRYAAYRKWGFETLSVSESELGGYKV